MKSSIVALAALVAGVSASNTTTASVYYTTTTVTAITTYCPSPTVIVHGPLTFTVTEATTLTITNCPCTAIVPVTVTSTSSCVTCALPTSVPVASGGVFTTSTSAGAVVTSIPVSSPAVSIISPPSSNYTITSAVPKITATQTLGVASPTTALPSSSTTALFTGAANLNKAGAASGAGLAGFLGLLAYIL